MLLPGNVDIQMIKCAVVLLAAIPSTLIFAHNFFMASAWALMLLHPGDKGRILATGQFLLKPL